MRSNKFVNGLLALVCLAGVSVAPLFAEEAASPAASAAAEDAAKKAAEAAEAAKVAAAEAAKKAAEVAAQVEALLKYIPEEISTANGKTLIARQQLLDFVRPQVAEALAAGVKLDDTMVQPFVYQIANMMSLNELVLGAAKAAGVKPDEKACQEELDGIIKQVGGADKLDEQLKAAGMTREFFMSKMRDQSVVTQFQEKLLADVKVPEVTEEELQKYYEENKERMKQPATLSAAHILVQFPSEKPSDEEKAAALKKILEIKAQLKEDGSNFAELAKLHSACPSAEQGGDLGSFQKGQMVPEFEEALLKLKEGEIGGPVETMFGYHLIKAGASTEEHVITLDEIKEEMKEYLQGQAELNVKGKAWGEKVEAIKKAADFKLLLPEPKMPEPPAPPKAEAPAEAEASAPVKAE